VFGKAYTEIYKTFIICSPVNYFTTKTSLIILEI